MTLIKFILSIFHTRWHEKIFVNAYQKYLRFSSFINEVFQNLYIINEIQSVYGSNVKFVLWASNSASYVSMFIALILKNVDFYLVSPKMSVSDITSIIVSSDVNVLLVSSDVSENRVTEKLSIYPCYKLSYNIENNNINYSKSKELNEKLNIDAIKRTINIIHDSTYNVTDVEDIIFHDFKVKPRNREIGVFSSGTNSIYPRAVYFNDEEVLSAILALGDSDILPGIQSKVVYSEVNFADAPVWTILWPIYAGALFSFSLHEADVVITNNCGFEHIWNKVSKNIYDIRFIGKLLFKNWLNWLFKIIARYKLKKYFNSDIKKSAIIILNAFLSPRITKTIVGHLPVYTTYGIQETNQIVAVNNYSTFQHMKDNCVGELIYPTTASIRGNELEKGEGSLVITSPLLSPFVEVEKSTYFDTRDHASLEVHNNRTLVYIYGRISYAIKDSTYFGHNLENLERILKNVPYFKDVLFYEDAKEDRHIIIFPNVEILECANFDLLDFKNFIKSYKLYINNMCGVDFVTDVKMIVEDFFRTHTGNVKKGLYFPANDIIYDL